jgi:hypothetical protein
MLSLIELYNNNPGECKYSRDYLLWVHHVRDAGMYFGIYNTSSISEWILLTDYLLTDDQKKGCPIE